jgi:hypothetical protein
MNTTTADARKEARLRNALAAAAAETTEKMRERRVALEGILEHAREAHKGWMADPRTAEAPASVMVEILAHRMADERDLTREQLCGMLALLVFEKAGIEI